MNKEESFLSNFYDIYISLQILIAFHHLKEVQMKHNWWRLHFHLIDFFFFYLTHFIVNLTRFLFLYFSSVITNTQEWKHFKQIYNVATPFEEDMFAAPIADSKFPEIFMRPKEMIYVPFKLFSLSSNHSQQPQVSSFFVLNFFYRYKEVV